MQVSDSPAYEARDEQTENEIVNPMPMYPEEKPAIVVTPFTAGSLLEIHLAQIDMELADSPTTERKNELLKERLDVLYRMVRERRSR